jgi:hypothetical protein
MRGPTIRSGVYGPGVEGHDGRQRNLETLREIISARGHWSCFVFLQGQWDTYLVTCWKHLIPSFWEEGRSEV